VLSLYRKQLAARFVAWREFTELAQDPSYAFCRMLFLPPLSCGLDNLTTPFSRYVAGWMIAPRGSVEPAEMLIADTVAGQTIEPGYLTLHADRGTSMRSKTAAALLVDLEVLKTHRRPDVVQ
jgi:hypothetical protein